MNNKLITILGPTATGKTRLAAMLAQRIGGEVISADSRQVYRGMDIGTGKDLADYMVDGSVVSYHLIDIVDAGYEYNVFEFVNDVHNAFEKIIEHDKTPILCGGTGMYLEAVLKAYDLKHVPVDKIIRKQLSAKTDEELIEILKEHRALHNVSDTKDRERLERAVEIVQSSEFVVQSSNNKDKSIYNSIIFGVWFEREEIRKRITERLKQRLNAGMIEEVKALKEKGISSEKLKYYGLEYKFISMFLESPQTTVDRQQLFEKLNIAIHQFAKRQMTWFRRMEKQGFVINWIDGKLTMEKKLEIILAKIKKP